MRLKGENLDALCPHSQSLVLMVSLGRFGAKTYPVIPFTGRRKAKQSTTYYLGNIERGRTEVCPHIKGLIEHYKYVLYQHIPTRKPAMTIAIIVPMLLATLTLLDSLLLLQFALTSKYVVP